MKQYLSAVDLKKYTCTLTKEYTIDKDDFTLWKDNDGNYIVRFDYQKGFNTKDKLVKYMKDFTWPENQKFEGEFQHNIEMGS